MPTASAALTGHGVLAAAAYAPPKTVPAVVYTSTGAGAHSGSSQTITWQHLIAGNAVIVLAGQWANSSSTTVTAQVGGTPMTLLASSVNYATSGGFFASVYLFGLLNPSTGTQTVSVTTTGTIAGGGALFGNSVAYADVTGFRSSLAANTSGTSATPTLSVSAVPGEMVTQGFGGFTTNFASYNQTSRYNGPFIAGQQLAFIVGDAPSAATVSFTCSEAFSAYGAVGVPLQGNGFTGRGALSGPGVPSLTSALSGRGVLAARAVPKLVAVLSGAGRLQAQIEDKTTAPLSGHGALTAKIVPSITGTIRGGGALKDRTLYPIAPGNGALTGAVYAKFPVAPGPQGRSILSAVVAAKLARAAALHGAGSLTAAAARRQITVAGTKGQGVLSATAYAVQFSFVAPFTGGGALTVFGRQISRLIGRGALSTTTAHVRIEPITAYELVGTNTCFDVADEPVADQALMYQLLGWMSMALDGSPAPAPTTTYFANFLNPALVAHVLVPFPASEYPLIDCVSDGITQTAKLIDDTPGEFVLAGWSQGALVASGLYDALRSGALSARNSDLIGAAVFGNPRRQHDHMFPTAPNPGGEGVLHTDTLTDCETRWFEFADPDDIIANNDHTTPSGAAVTAAFEVLDQSWDGTQASLSTLLASQPVYPLIDTFTNLLATLWNMTDPAHLGYGAAAPLAPADPRTCPQIAADYFHSLALGWDTTTPPVAEADSLGVQITVPQPSVGDSYTYSVRAFNTATGALSTAELAGPPVISDGHVTLEVINLASNNHFELAVVLGTTYTDPVVAPRSLMSNRVTAPFITRMASRGALSATAFAVDYGGSFTYKLPLRLG